MKRLLSLSALSLLLSAALAACAGTPTLPWERPSSDPNVREKPVNALGAHFIVRLWLDPKDRRNVESLFRPAVAEILRVAKITDSDDAKSEISHLNYLAATTPVQISPDLAFLLVTSQKLHERTGGIFDVTFAPIQDQVESYGPDAGLEGSDREFTPSGVDKDTRQRIGQRNWTLDTALRKVKFSKPGIKLVVKGIARGYAAQKAAEKLLPLKLKGFAIIAGNTFVASGAALNDSQLMCIENFGHPGRCQYRVKALHPEKLFAMGMAASSDRPGHNYNPKSGSRTYRTGGAAVCGSDGTWTQGAATAASILDESKFYEFFKSTEPPRLSGLWAGESSESGPQGSLEPYASSAPIAE